MLESNSTLEWTPEDYRRADALSKHRFELTDSCSIYCHQRKMSPKQNSIVRTEIKIYVGRQNNDAIIFCLVILVVFASKNDGNLWL